MAQVTVKFECTPGAGVQAYWIAVGDENVPLNNGKGSLKLATSQKHFLIWWFVGNSGSKLAIVGKKAGTEVVKVSGSKVPAGETEGAGAKRFAL